MTEILAHITFRQHRIKTQHITSHINATFSPHSFGYCHRSRHHFPLHHCRRRRRRRRSSFSTNIARAGRNDSIHGQLGSKRLMTLPGITERPLVAGLCRNGGDEWSERAPRTPTDTHISQGFEAAIVLFTSAPAPMLTLFLVFIPTQDRAKCRLLLTHFQWRI